MRRRKFASYHRLCKYLKNELPVDYPISIRRTPTAHDIYGDCWFDGKKFHIRINNQLSEDAAKTTVLHELSHVISWFKKDEDHGKSFGLAYAKVYNYFLGWTG